jgi:hypothetical protein
VQTQPRTARALGTAGAVIVYMEGEVLEQVTNKVTTAPGNRRRSATYEDTAIPLTSSNPT